MPHSTIELQITTNLVPIKGNELHNTLLAIHEYTGDHIGSEGDGTLFPKDDPFVWDKAGPPPRTGVYLEVQSAKRERMTWGVLQIAVEGLYLALPAVGRNVEARFEVFDWRSPEHGGGLWGFGALKNVNAVKNAQLLSLFNRNYSKPSRKVVEDLT